MCFGEILFLGLEIHCYRYNDAWSNSTFPLFFPGLFQLRKDKRSASPREAKQRGAKTHAVANRRWCHDGVE